MMDELVRQERLSPNRNARQLPVTMVVLHYTEMASAQAAIDRLCDPLAKVSAHYLISASGEITRLVPEGERAWHAGVSCWRGVRDVNSASVGIELDHPGHLGGYPPFPKAQIDALLPLLSRIVKTHAVPRANVVGHSDIAPTRKIDPGELFPWDRLASHGLCLPVPRITFGDPYDSDSAFLLALERYGYDITDERKAVEAFQRRWRPARIDGVIDGEIRALLFQLLLDRDRGGHR